MAKNNKDKKTEGFFRIDHSLVKDEAVIARVGVNAWAVYTILLSYVNKETGLSYPSYRKIREKTGIGQSTVSKALDKLEEHGLVEQVSKGTKQGDNNNYLIHPHPTKNVESDGKRKMSRPKPGKTKKDDVSFPIDASLAPVTLEEPVKVSKPETPNKLSQEDIMKSFSKLCSPFVAATVETTKSTPVEELWEDDEIEVYKYKLDDLAREVWELGQKTGSKAWKGYMMASLYISQVNQEKGSLTDKKRKQLKLKQKLQKELGMM